MNTHTLGHSGIVIGEIGLGCWAIGGPFWDRGGWMGYGDADDAESLRCLRRAVFAECFQFHNNSKFWAKKFAENVQRDADKIASLREAGWDVLVIWERELRDKENSEATLRTFFGTGRK